MAKYHGSIDQSIKRVCKRREKLLQKIRCEISYCMPGYSNKSNHKGFRREDREQHRNYPAGNVVAEVLTEWIWRTLAIFRPMRTQLSRQRLSFVEIAKRYFINARYFVSDVEHLMRISRPARTVSKTGE